MQGGGGPPYSPTIRSGTRIAAAVQKTIQRQKEQLETVDTMKDRLKRVEQFLTQKIQDIVNRIEWYLVDHGESHCSRAAKNVDKVDDVLDESSLTRSSGAGPFSEKDLLLIKIAVHAHDIGRGEQDGGSHAERSAKYILGSTDLPLSREEKDFVAGLCLLHSDGNTRMRYGTADLNDLVRRGLLTPKEGVAATLLRVADALDAGTPRAEHNSQGEKFERVAQRIRSELPAGDADTRLAHWLGHRGFQTPILTTERGEASLKIRLNDASLRSHGAQVAYRIKDLLRDISTTLIDKAYRVTFSGRNRQTVRDWLTKHAPILTDELGGINVTT